MTMRHIHLYEETATHCNTLQDIATHCNILTETFLKWLYGWLLKQIQFPSHNPHGMVPCVCCSVSHCVADVSEMTQYVAECKVHRREERAMCVLSSTRDVCIIATEICVWSSTWNVCIITKGMCESSSAKRCEYLTNVGCVYNHHTDVRIIITKAMCLSSSTWNVCIITKGALQ